MTSSAPAANPSTAATDHAVQREVGDGADRQPGPGDRRVPDLRGLLRQVN
jgi:hypothetical protein